MIVDRLELALDINSPSAGIGGIRVLPPLTVRIRDWSTALFAIFSRIEEDIADIADGL
jgi:hypothetical protein